MPGADDSANHAASPQVNVESSDSEDQFTDAQSAPMSPRQASPTKKSAEEASSELPKIEEPSDSERSSTPKDAKLETVSVSSADEENETPVSPKETQDVPTNSSKDGSPDTPLKPNTASITEADSGSSGLSSPDAVESLSKAVPETGSEPREQSLNEEDLPTPVPQESLEPPNEAEASEDDDGEGEGEGDDAFGDDFDDFEEGGGEDAFGDFEDDFQQPEPSRIQEQVPPVQQTALPFSIPNFEGQSTEDIMATVEPYLASLFPPEELDLPQFPPLSKTTTTFATPRSASLWSQLVAPPPLAPPDWIRSRTRRLFLVSLGVPVDLDEILPASKQKKLVLPSLNIPSGASPRTSSDSRSISRLRQGDANTSSTSVDTQGKPKKRKGPPPQPEFDMVTARHLCVTTDEALDGMTDEELKSHIAKLEGLQETAKEVLEFWQKRTDEKIAERETFEGVIENLVKHARKVRK